MTAWLRARGPRTKAAVGALLALLVLLPAWWWGSRWQEGQLLSEHRAHTAIEVSLRGHALSLAIAQRLALLRGLASFAEAVGSEPAFGAQFEHYAAHLCAEDKEQGIRNTAVAPQGVVRYVYPSAGNEAMVGYAPLLDPLPEVRADAQRAIDSRQIILSAAQSVVQGEMTLVARQAVYAPVSAGGGEAYWGLVHVVLDLSSLLAEAGLGVAQNGLEFALRDSSGEVFYGSPTTFDQDPVISVVALPDGEWRLAGAPRMGWQAAIVGSLRLYQVSAGLVVLLLVGLAYGAATRQATLSAAVRQRTAELSAANQRLEADIAERVQVDDALRTSEANLRALIEQAPLAIQVCAPDGRTLHVNEAYKRLWGCEEAEVLGTNILAGECPIPKALPGAVERGFAGERVHVPPTRYTNEQLPSIPPDRSRWVETFVYPVTGGERAIQQVIVICSDVTQQRMAEETLRVSEERFRGAFEHAAIGMALVGLDGRFLQVNPSVCRMFGYSEHELLGKTFQELTYHADLDVGLELFADLVNGVRDYGWLEKRYLHKDGHVVWTLLSTSTVRNAEGETQYLVSQIQDITQRRRAEARLAEKEAQYRSIFEATRDALIITHPDGHIVEANPAACQMYGYEYDELVNCSLADLIQPEHEALFSEMLEKVRRGEPYSVQATDRRKDGSPFHVEVLVSNFTYAGQPHILSVIRDVSERVRARQLLEQRVHERTRELSTLLRVSHDIASNLDLEPLLSAVLDRLGEVVAYHAAAIWISAPQGEMALMGYRGPIPRESLPGQWQQQALEHVGEVIARREPLTIADVRADTGLARSWQRATRAQLGYLPEHVASWMGVPLLVKDRVIGMISLEHGQPDYYTAYHAELALAFANQAAIAIDNARLYRRSQRLAVLEERQRIARELHDSVSQALYGIGLGARTARAQLDRDPRQAVEPVEYVLSLAEAGLAEMRALIFELRPDALAQEGLVSALGKRAAALRSRYGIEVETDLGREPRLSLEVKEALYRVAQEALNNVIKHARARRVAVQLVEEGGGILLSVEDDGVGFVPQGEYPGHIGLHTMRERMEEIAGALSIESAPGQGTRLHARVPLESHREG